LEGGNGRWVSSVSVKKGLQKDHSLQTGSGGGEGRGGTTKSTRQGGSPGNGKPVSMKEKNYGQGERNLFLKKGPHSLEKKKNAGRDRPRKSGGGWPLVEEPSMGRACRKTGKRTCQKTGGWGSSRGQERERSIGLGGGGKRVLFKTTFFVIPICLNLWYLSLPRKIRCPGEFSYGGERVKIAVCSGGIGMPCGESDRSGQKRCSGKSKEGRENY